MPETFLDSSIVIGLIFRHAAERRACRAVLSLHERVFCSRYVIFEVARGYLRSLIALNNYSLEFSSFAGFHQAAHSGQQRFKPYRMHTWLGAFDDYFAALEAEDGPTSDALKLEEFRAKLRGWIRRGWHHIQNDFQLFNDIGCREDLPPPTARGDDRIDQLLPIDECGNPAACRLQTFIQERSPQVRTVALALEALPTSSKDSETLGRIDALNHLLARASGEEFEGRKCWRCGDALICMEAPHTLTIATKNRKHFEPLVVILGKRLLVAGTARTTKAKGSALEL